MKTLVRNRRSAAFSLVELLVGVAIMCILAAILLPHYLGGKDALTGKKIVAPRDRAKQSVGVSYIGQIDQAITMYKMDNDDKLPPDLNSLKRYGVMDEMLLDPVTHKPLSYDPKTGVIGNSTGLSQGPDSLGGGQTLPKIGQ